MTAQGGARNQAVVVVPASLVVAGVLSVLFVALRFAITWQAPVGGSELFGLSGAWQATVGDAGDERFVPTLFQAMSAVLLAFRNDELLPRLLALVVTLTIPMAFHLLRPVLGLGAAMVSLLLFAVDPVNIWLGVAASPAAFDGAITIWLLVLVTRPFRKEGLRGIAFAGGGFAAATGGALLLPFVFAVVTDALLRRSALSWKVIAPLGAGAIGGIVLASAGFGYGWQGLTIPPFESFAHQFDADGASPVARDLVLLYGWPVLAFAAVAVAFVAWEHKTAGQPLGSHLRLLFVWFAVSVLSLFAANAAHSELPIAAATLPACFVVASAVAPALRTFHGQDWRIAGTGVAVMLLLLTLIAAIVVDWARQEEIGAAGGVARVLILAAGMAVAAAFLLRFRALAPSLVLVPTVVFAVAVLPGAVNVGLSGKHEPLPSPLSASQARNLRDIAVAAREEHGGLIVVHDDFREAITWPFRDSGTIVLATNIPPDATFLVWPAGVPQPEGFDSLSGEWALQRTIEAPTSSVLDVLHWLSDRNEVEVSRLSIAVYMKQTE